MIGLGQVLGLVAVNDDDRRIAPTLVGIAQLDAPPAHQRWLVIKHGLFQYPGEFGGGQVTVGRGIGAVHRAEQLTDPGAVQGGDKKELGEIEERQLEIDLPLQPVLLAGFHAVPLVDRHHQGTALLQHIARQGGVLLRDTALPGVQHQHHHVGCVDSLQGFDDAEFFHCFTNPAATSHPGGIDEGIAHPVAFEGNEDAVAGGARLVEGDDALLAEDTIHQGGLAHIGPADDGDMNAAHAHGGRVCRVRLRQGRQHFLHEVGDAATLAGGNGMGRAQAQAIELRRRHVGVDGIGLVDRQEHPLAGTAQLLRDALVAAVQAGATIHQQQYGIGLLHGLPDLFGHGAVHAFRVVGQATGIHHQVGPLADLAIAILAITGQPGHVRHQRITGTGQAVEEGGFAHIGTTHQGDYGKHAGLDVMTRAGRVRSRPKRSPM